MNIVDSFILFLGLYGYAASFGVITRTELARQLRIHAEWREWCALKRLGGKPNITYWQFYRACRRIGRLENNVWWHW